ncbi:DUF1810 family protein [Flavobacterium sp.]|jgi:uncharacterized protein (DUF1810 family)|uniref:DUF1810 family protein n=1 Tax=Flavobacterium sp. TaxID=239 RepID=UPI0037C071A9
MYCNYEKFLIAQESDYSLSHNKIKIGRKTSNCMWYIFPQIEGLGLREKSIVYTIKDIDMVFVMKKH